MNEVLLIGRRLYLQLVVREFNFEIKPEALSHVLDDLETKRNAFESKLSLYLIERTKLLTNPE